jgi:signal transduction histidine kinase
MTDRPARRVGPGAAPSAASLLHTLADSLAHISADEDLVPNRVAQFRRKATKLLLIEQWVLLIPIAVTAHFTGNSVLGLLIAGAVFHAITTFGWRADPIGLATRCLIANGLLMDVLLLIYALSGAGSWQMDGGHMWVFAVWSHALGLLCWRSLLASGTLAVLHHFVLIFLFPLWVFPDGANLWRVVLHASVVALQISVLCVFVFLIKQMLTRAEELERKLEATLDMVREASSSKSRFLAHMSHELRTPLNAIIGFSDAMKGEMFGDLSPRYLEYVELINTSGKHLHDLINDVLDLSRVEAGKHDIHDETFDLAATIEDCLGMVGERARNAGVKLLVMAAPPAVTLRADPRATKQVLLNLLTNAVKYTGAGGSVMISWADGAGGLAVSIADTGVGISDQALHTVFEPFQRGDSMVASKTEGTGLGLAISRKLMELHDGTLTLSSKPGVGTVATMLFPASRIVRPAVVADHGDQPDPSPSLVNARIAGQSAAE